MYIDDEIILKIMNELRILYEINNLTAKESPVNAVWQNADEQGTLGQYTVKEMRELVVKKQLPEIIKNKLPELIDFIEESYHNSIVGLHITLDVIDTLKELINQKKEETEKCH